MNRSNKFLSCLISALMIYSFCYGVDYVKDQPKDVPEKSFTSSVKEFFGIKKSISPEEKAQKKFDTIPKDSDAAKWLAESLVRKEQVKVNVAEAKVEVAKQNVVTVTATPSILDTIKSVFGFGAKDKLAAAQKKLSSNQAKLEVYQSLTFEGDEKSRKINLERLNDDLINLQRDIKNAWTKPEINFVNKAIDEIVKEEKDKSSDIDDIVKDATLDESKLKTIATWKGAFQTETYEKRFKELLKLKLQIARQQSAQEKSQLAVPTAGPELPPGEKL